MTDTSLWPSFLVPFERELSVVGDFAGIMGFVVSLFALYLAYRAIRKPRTTVQQAESSIGAVSDHSQDDGALIYLPLLFVSISAIVAFVVGLIGLGIAQIVPENDREFVPLAFTCLGAIMMSMFAGSISSEIWESRIPKRTILSCLVWAALLSFYIGAMLPPSNPTLLSLGRILEICAPVACAVVGFSLARRLTFT